MVRQRPPDHLPPAVLTRSDFVEACGRRDLGRIFQIGMKWGGLGFTVSHLARRCEMTIGQVQDYTKRGRQASSIDVIERVADGLHIPGGMLNIGTRAWEREASKEPARASKIALGERGLPAEPGGPSSVAWTVDGTLVTARDISEVSPVDRRSFLLLTGAALTAPAHEWLIARPLEDVSSASGRTVEPKLIDHLDDMTAELRRMDDQMGGGSLIDLVRAQIRYVTRLLKDGRYTDSVGRRLHTTLGELLRLGGWVSYDDGHLAEAQRFWIGALRAAHTAGDSAMGANILGFMSEPAWNAGRPDDAIKLTATALAGYKGRSPHVKAILQMRAALPLAVNGDDAECRRAIDSAYSAFRDSPPETGEPDWSYWMDEGSLNEQIGICSMLLGDYHSAASHLQYSLDIDQNGQVREGVVRLIYLANAYMGEEKLELACDVGTKAVDELLNSVNSPRLNSRIHQLASSMGEHGPSRVVREFREKSALLHG